MTDTTQALIDALEFCKSQVATMLEWDGSAVLFYTAAADRICNKVDDALAAVKAEQPEHIHSCGYHCNKPVCIKDQRDKLVTGFINALDYPNSWDVMAYPSFESALKEVYAHFKSTKRESALQELVDISQENNIGYGDKE